MGVSESRSGQDTHAAGRQDNSRETPTRWGWRGGTGQGKGTKWGSGLARREDGRGLRGEGLDFSSCPPHSGCGLAGQDPERGPGLAAALEEKPR